MNKIIVGMVSTCILLLSGCAAVLPQKQQDLDVEPILVGKPVSERIKDTENSVDGQLELLSKIELGKKVGSYNVVTHNNNLDARIGSSMTLPQSYAQIKNVKVEELKTESKNTEVKSIQKVKKIIWTNNSLNKLSKNLADALGYTLVIKDGKLSDKDITFAVENKTLLQVVDKLKIESAEFADIIVVEQNKTLNIIYK
jgi:hypothetical protein